MDGASTRCTSLAWRTLLRTASHNVGVCNTYAVQLIKKIMPGGQGSAIAGTFALLGCLEVGGGWCFDALHVAGVENTIADGISQWESEAIDDDFSTFRPDVAWR